MPRNTICPDRKGWLASKTSPCGFDSQSGFHLMETMEILQKYMQDFLFVM
jgi:hypothetical protein